MSLIIHASNKLKLKLTIKTEHNPKTIWKVKIQWWCYAAVRWKSALRWRHTAMSIPCWDSGKYLCRKRLWSGIDLMFSIVRHKDIIYKVKWNQCNKWSCMLLVWAFFNDRYSLREKYNGTYHMHFHLIDHHDIGKSEQNSLW